MPHLCSQLPRLGLLVPSPSGKGVESLLGEGQGAESPSSQHTSYIEVACDDPTKAEGGSVVGICGGLTLIPSGWGLWLHSPKKAALP